MWLRNSARRFSERDRRKKNSFKSDKDVYAMNQQRATSSNCIDRWPAGPPQLSLLCSSFACPRRDADGAVVSFF